MKDAIRCNEVEKELEILSDTESRPKDISEDNEPWSHPSQMITPDKTTEVLWHDILRSFWTFHRSRFYNNPAYGKWEKHMLSVTFLI